MIVRSNYNQKFKPLYYPKPTTRIIICIGGRGGMKTYEVSRFAAFSATILNKRVAVMRDEKSTIKESILNEINLRYDSANESGILDTFYTKLENGIKHNKTNRMVLFTKGFKASSSDKGANLKSISDVDIAIVEEAEDIRNEDKFNTFADSIRKQGSLIIIILNTPDINHWVVKRYFTLKIPVLNGKQLDGYFELIPKELEDVEIIMTSYTDNKYLPEHINKSYANYGNPEHPTFNPFYYYTAILGYSSTGRKGQIITKAIPIKLKDYLELPYKEHYGQDFGTASPAGLIGLKKHRNNIYVRQLNYKPLEVLDIAKMYHTLGFRASDTIVVDCADDKAYKRLKRGYDGHELSEQDFIKYPTLRHGFNVRPSSKGADSVRYGIDLINSSNFHVVEESQDYWNEIYNYVWAVDKNQNPTDEPIDDFNHLIDPTRYVLVELEKNRSDWDLKRRN